jgi:hypothetical protein
MSFAFNFCSIMLLEKVHSLKIAVSLAIPVFSLIRKKASWPKEDSVQSKQLKFLESQEFFLICLCLDLRCFFADFSAYPNYSCSRS